MGATKGRARSEDACVSEGEPDNKELSLSDESCSLDVPLSFSPVSSTGSLFSPAGFRRAQITEARGTQQNIHALPRIPYNNHCAGDWRAIIILPDITVLLLHFFPSSPRLSLCPPRVSFQRARQFEARDPSIQTGTSSSASRCYGARKGITTFIGTCRLLFTSPTRRMGTTTARCITFGSGESSTKRRGGGRGGEEVATTATTATTTTSVKLIRRGETHLRGAVCPGICCATVCFDFRRAMRGFKWYLKLDRGIEEIGSTGERGSCFALNYFTLRSGLPWLLFFFCSQG